MLSNRRLVFVSAILFLMNVVAMVLFVRFKSGEKCIITVDAHGGHSGVVPDSFLSIGIDTSEIENYQSINFSNGRLRKLASYLGPGHLRLGGTMSDRLIFSAEDESLTCEICHKNNFKGTCSSVRKMCRHKFVPFFIMTGSKWVEINEFCKATNMTLLFTFNALLRNENGWNDENARELLWFTRSKGYNSINFQLGNEPNSFHYVFNVTLSPKELAHDFKKLRHLLNEMGFKESLLVGPDTSSPRPHHLEGVHYMVDFLGNASHSINVGSWHQYYLNSRTAKLNDFWNYSTFDILTQQIRIINNNTRKFKKIPIWLTETSSSYGGGAPGLSNSFAGTPLWIDKLGVAAKLNIKTVVRQSFYGGNYSLVDDAINPLPDWWVSVMYRMLIGNKVLSVKCQCSQSQRIYAHCTNKNYVKDSSAITIYGINLDLKKVVFKLNGTGISEGNLDIDEYIFSAPSNNRLSKTVLLNGWPLYFESTLPEMKPVHVKYGRQITMPPYSVGFWVVKNTSVSICKQNLA